MKSPARKTNIRMRQSFCRIDPVGWAKRSVPTNQYSVGNGARCPPYKQRHSGERQNLFHAEAAGTTVIGTGKVPASLPPTSVVTSGPGPEGPWKRRAPARRYRSSSSISLVISSAFIPSRTNSSGTISSKPMAFSFRPNRRNTARALLRPSSRATSSTPSHLELGVLAPRRRAARVAALVRSARLAAKASALSHSGVSSTTTRNFRLCPSAKACRFRRGFAASAALFLRPRQFASWLPWGQHGAITSAALSWGAAASCFSS